MPANKEMTLFCKLKAKNALSKVRWFFDNSFATKCNACGR